MCNDRQLVCITLLKYLILSNHSLYISHTVPYLYSAMLPLIHTNHWKNTVKPIFHCDAKPFALGPRSGLDPKRHNFALGIPTCWYLKMLKLAANAKIWVTPNARGWRWACRFHVVYFLFPSVGYATRTQFPVEYGLNCKEVFEIKKKTKKTD